MEKVCGIIAIIGVRTYRQTNDVDLPSNEDIRSVC